MQDKKLSDSRNKETKRLSEARGQRKVLLHEKYMGRKYKR